VRTIFRYHSLACFMGHFVILRGNQTLISSMYHKLIHESIKNVQRECISYFLLLKTIQYS
jgi:hypothetical protein